MPINFAEHAYGLDNDRARRVNEMIQEHYPQLSLRRIPDTDPFFTPEKPWGVWEDTVLTHGTGQTNWVFSVSEYGLDARVLARIFEGDMSRPEVANRKMEAIFDAERAHQQREYQEEMERRADEVLQFLLVARGKNYLTMNVDGDRVRIGDGPAERTRSFIV